MPGYVPPGTVQAAAKLGQQVKHLNSYLCYYDSADGDFPVSVVASSIEEAAKLGSMSGVVSQDSIQPKIIKFNKSTVAVAMPVNMIGFDTVVEPAAATLSGAYATPAHYEVRNGDNVIFQAYCPFGWTFDGWYKYGDENRISDSPIAEIDVYDNYATRLKYIAKFTSSPSWRSGRYIDLNSGIVFSFDFTRYGEQTTAPYGRVVVGPNTQMAAHLIITEILPEPDNTIVTNYDPAYTGPGVDDETAFKFSAVYSFSPIGVNLQFLTLGGPLSDVAGAGGFPFVTQGFATLKFIGDL
jgi:hypothetical protein